ncbi:hypothetical protein [Pseudomonas sp. MGal98]
METFPLGDLSLQEAHIQNMFGAMWCCRPAHYLVKPEKLVGKKGCSLLVH